MSLRVSSLLLLQRARARNTHDAREGGKTATRVDHGNKEKIITKTRFESKTKVSFFLNENVFLPNIDIID